MYKVNIDNSRLDRYYAGVTHKREDFGQYLTVWLLSQQKLLLWFC